MFEFIDIMNAERSLLSLDPVVYNPCLTLAAKRHALDMAENQDISHQGSDGTWPDERIDDAFYNDGGETFIVGENAAYGGSSAQDVFNIWKNSPPHYNAMVNKRFREVGFYFQINHDDGYIYWCLTFGAHAEHKTTAER